MLTPKKKRFVEATKSFSPCIFREISGIFCCRKLSSAAARVTFKYRVTLCTAFCMFCISMTWLLILTVHFILIEMVLETRLLGGVDSGRAREGTRARRTYFPAGRAFRPLHVSDEKLKKGKNLKSTYRVANETRAGIVKFDKKGHRQDNPPKYATKVKCFC